MSFRFKWSAIAYLILFVTALVLTLVGCAGMVPRVLGESPTLMPSAVVAESDTQASTQTILWRSDFDQSNWLDNWQKRDRDFWGLENLEVVPDRSGQFSQVLRANYPAGSASPTVTRNIGAPVGGGQFYGELGISPHEALRLSYYIRFSDHFDFVKGGKLPGLFGGDGASGRVIPTGTDGFSTRYMWRQRGDGEVYAYLPASTEHGTSLGRGEWRFRSGVWHRIEQEVVLNHVNQTDGQIRVWFDGDQVLDEDGLTFRSVDTLQINGIFFSTFFGGGDPSWATPADVYTDFADFVIYAVDVPA
ncbi:MAG: hypothetical protein SFY66_22150 [Oculatellaceae cyanobacterium bins.114]|nr:hypothetical protein [Oculatellaceae cyanobacterium bins.114]